MDAKSSVAGGGESKSKTGSSKQISSSDWPPHAPPSEHEEMVELSEKISELLQTEMLSQSDMGGAAVLQMVNLTRRADGRLHDSKCNQIHLQLPEGFIESLSEQQKALLCGDAVINIVGCEQKKHFQQPMGDRSGTTRRSSSPYDSKKITTEDDVEQHTAESVIRGVVEDVLGSDEEEIRIESEINPESEQGVDNYQLFRLGEPECPIADPCEQEEIRQMCNAKFKQPGYPCRSYSHNDYKSQNCMSGHPWDTFVGQSNPTQHVRPVRQDAIGTEVKQVRQYYEQPVKGGVWYGYLPHPEFPGSCEPEHDMDLNNWLSLVDVEGMPNHNDIAVHCEKPEAPEDAEVCGPPMKVYLLDG